MTVQIETALSPSIPNDPYARRRVLDHMAEVENDIALRSQELPDPKPVKDASWVGRSFMRRNAGINDSALSRENLKSNHGKFWDTTLGGYRAINPSPQFTRYADIKAKSRDTSSRGLGRYYSEALDAPAQIIHMRFGVPEYNSLGGFLSGMYNSTAGKLARTGEGESFFTAVAGAAGFLITIPLTIINSVYRQIGSLFFNIPYNRYYYSKPSMPMYYNAVNTMLVKLAVNMKLIEGAELETPANGVTKPTDGKGFEAYSMKSILSPAARQQMFELMPDIFNPETGFDIYAVSRRHQALANQQYATMAKLTENANTMEELAQAIEDEEQKVLVDSSSSARTIKAYQEAYFNTGAAGKGLDTAPETGEPPIPQGIVDEALKEGSKIALDTVRGVGEWFSSTAEMLENEFMGGSQWVNFKVESTGSVSESFSSSTADSALAEKINSASSTARATKFNMAGGNIGDNPFADAMEWAVSATAGVVGGVANAASNVLGFGDLGVALGGGIVDIPKYWENSESNMSKGDYTMKLRAVYGNKLSIFKDIYVPLCMLLGAALPKSTGTNSYTSPFLVELFDKGRIQTSLGLIDNISIERGTGNLGWSIDHLPTGIDVSFSVLDLSNVLHMPVSGESLSFNDKSMYNDYMAVLGGLGALEQLTVADRWKRKKNTLSAEFSQWFSASHFASWAGNTLPGRAIGTVLRNSDILGT